jgi:hypothetical protein
LRFVQRELIACVATGDNVAKERLSQSALEEEEEEEEEEEGRQKKINDLERLGAKNQHRVRLDFAGGGRLGLLAG